MRPEKPPKSWPSSLMVRRSPGRYLLDQWMADHGYVVVAIDGRGTPSRGAAWQREVRRDLRSDRVVATVCGGRLVWQAPARSG